ncbi:MAG: 23S rRNA (pseudouridine(1915)-N(3))-methyltransferase RlmH [Candidatus Sericytochromatia bacterium]|uniref:Ribosomal RNA large subunit methyltransferase H n=1 Tax=Candidatus Tanganyikabacteria bacterium TaxID=2961651 RepID=A0A937X501_9BACT|nr:23S rRNA (pseudouridine(1915)-N(3))-methyltransferase RlmH [Candidatus Tanganyikabacteria bacterium]
MRWILVAVGKLKDAHYRDGAAEYLARLARSRPFKLVEISDAPVKPGREAAALREEAERIRLACGGARIVALTERGEQLSTSQLAAKLGAQEALGGDLAFVIGGANGLEGDLERGADWQLALSALTLPHQLARVVLLEQLYRVETMRRGEPYHRAGTVG